jgi:hypothetical protein
MKTKLKILSFIFLAFDLKFIYADVTLYGKVASGIENDQFQNSNAISSSSVQDYGSYFGIRGIDPIYGTTSTIWQVEQYLDIAAGQVYNATTGSGMIIPNPKFPNSPSNHVNGQTNVLASSETYIGLQGDFGKIRLGNLANFMRSNMGNVDIFNYGNGANGLGVFSRTNKLLPTSIRYDTNVWKGFSLMGIYSFNSNGLNSASGVNGGNNFGSGLSGYYAGGIYSFGINWVYENWSVALGTTIWENVGSYSTATNGVVESNKYPDASYNTAYANRLEISYNDPDGIILGVGLQTANGMAWNSWPNSGGRLGVVYNQAFANPANKIFNTKSIQTQEIAAALGYHFGQWTPKVGYVHGGNWMKSGDVISVILGSADQIDDTGYDQFVAELDLNITPRTIVFINFGQVFYGNTLSNIAFGPDSSGSQQFKQNNVDASNSYLNNQFTIAVGFSHTF